jgi:hypothetical protein
MTHAELTEAVRICLLRSNPQGLVDGELGQYFVAELKALIPADAAVGVAGQDDGLAVLGLGDADLVVSRAARGPEGELQFRSTVLALSPPPRIELESTVSVDRRSRSRRWSLSPVIGDAIELETGEVLHADFSSDIRPDSGELVLRALAERLSEAGGRT